MEMYEEREYDMKKLLFHNSVYEFTTFLVISEIFNVKYLLAYWTKYAIFAEPNREKDLNKDLKNPLGKVQTELGALCDKAQLLLMGLKDY